MRFFIYLVFLKINSLEFWLLSRTENKDKGMKNILLHEMFFFSDFSLLFCYFLMM